MKHQLALVLFILAAVGCKQVDGSKTAALNCQGGLPGRLHLEGALNAGDEAGEEVLDPRLKIAQVIGKPSKIDPSLMKIEKSVEFAESKSQPSLNNILINWGCPADFVAKYRGQLTVTSFNVRAAVADTVLLCGESDELLAVTANRVVMAGFDLKSASASPVQITTDKLVIEMDSRITTLGMPSTMMGFAAGDINLTVNQGIEGAGSLELFSKGLDCRSVEAAHTKQRLAAKAEANAGLKDSAEGSRSSRGWRADGDSRDSRKSTRPVRPVGPAEPGYAGAGASR